MLFLSIVVVLVWLLKPKKASYEFAYSHLNGLKIETGQWPIFVRESLGRDDASFLSHVQLPGHSEFCIILGICPHNKVDGPIRRQKKINGVLRRPKAFFLMKKKIKRKRVIVMSITFPNLVRFRRFPGWQRPAFTETCGVDHQSSDEGDMTKERSHVEVGLVRRVPSTVGLVGKSVRRGDGAEKVHAPVGALGLAGVDVEEAQRDLHVGEPECVGLVDGRVGGELVAGEIGDVEPVEGGTGCSDLGGVVYEGRERDVVGGYFEF